MENSRDINKLRSDIKANCQILLDACIKAGFDTRLSCTYRDQEYQTSLWKQGKAPQFVTFHGKGLAFDVFLQSNGVAVWNNTSFWQFISVLAKQIGFTWMQDITGADKPHFQWDEHGKYSGTQVRNGTLPPLMPLYIEKVDEITELVNSIQKKYGLNSPDYWISILKGNSVVSKANLIELFKKFNNI